MSDNSHLTSMQYEIAEHAEALAARLTELTATLRAGQLPELVLGPSFETEGNTLDHRLSELADTASELTDDDPAHTDIDHL
ncbi:hypothetical protein ACFYT3_30525 [Nocardia amikacinitolerans]|uniref:hypothetical protein n=1 Tax=Nocardia amikacinitolerans TaxID=756689 RepID=UPI0036B86420